MGYMRHHAILVTSWSEELITAAHREAQRIFADVPSSVLHKERKWSDLISPAQEAVINGYWSFAIFPDGSTEFWPDSDAGNRRRTAFIEWLRTQYDEEGSSAIDWVEVQYGDDERETRVTASSDDDSLSGERDAESDDDEEEA